jgi:hypothetical protein
MRDVADIGALVEDGGRIAALGLTRLSGGY